MGEYKILLCLRVCHSYDGERFNKNEKEQLDYSFILLDEAGMIDSELFYSLLKAINFSRTILMIAGDSAQLQSVGNGDLYSDILLNSLCQTVTLDKVYRQKEEQVINLVAQSVRVAQMPSYYADSGFDDFKFIRAYRTDIIEQIRVVTRTYLIGLRELLNEQRYGQYITEFQVIAPMKKKEIGVYALNNVLQEIINASTDEDDNKIVVIKNYERNLKIKENDKVIHLKNQKTPIQVISATVRVTGDKG